MVPLQGSLTGGIVTGDQAIWATLNQGVVLIDSATRAIVATVVIPGTAGIVSHPNSIIVTGQTAWVVTKDDIVVRIDPMS